MITPVAIAPATNSRRVNILTSFTLLDFQFLS
jgi:hypothetical protein